MDTFQIGIAVFAIGVTMLLLQHRHAIRRLNQRYTLVANALVVIGRLDEVVAECQKEQEGSAVESASTDQKS